MINIKWQKDSADRPRVCEKDGVVYLSYPALERTGLVKHGFSTRLGGVSGGMWSTMNLSFTRGTMNSACGRISGVLQGRLGFQRSPLCVRIRHTR